jgi:beta-fructofuranosidase
MATPATWSQVAPSLKLDNPNSRGDGKATIFSNIRSPVAVKGGSAAAQVAVHAQDEKAFDRWRPRLHLMPRRNWVNDPCGPCYSSSDGGFYHMAFQWNPEGWTWGNMSWGHALSRDLVHWKVSLRPSIQPSGDQDPQGVFTGCTWPTNLQGKADDTITSFYTSAQRSPIHWTLPYQKGSELVRIAISNDQGRTWQRHHSQALVPGPPEGLDVTGWRDPFIGPWESVDKCLGRRTGDHMYGILAGGVRHSSPAVFLYSIDAHDLTQWSFLCTPIAPGINFAPSPGLPDFGTNWEVTNFMTLQDQFKHSYDVLVMSVEGIRPRSNRVSGSREGRERRNKARRSDRAQNWLCARVKTPNGDPGNHEQPAVELEFRFGGCLDWGCFYAANSFFDPVTEKRIVHGWILEEDLPPSLTARQEWSGLLSLPRVLGMTRIVDVVSSSHSEIEALDWIHWSRSAEGTYAVTTLTSTPDPRLSALRHNEKRLVNLPAPLSVRLDAEDTPASTHMLRFNSKSIEVQASFSVTGDVEQIGLELYFSSGEHCP